jgi:hypothetical protein
MSGPRLVTWSETQLKRTIFDCLLNDTWVGSQAASRLALDGVAGVLAERLTDPEHGTVRVVSPLDNPDLEEQVADAIRPTLRFLEGTHASRDIAALDAARAALRVVFPQ